MRLTVPNRPLYIYNSWQIHTPICSGWLIGKLTRGQPEATEAFSLLFRGCDGVFIFFSLCGASRVFVDVPHTAADRGQHKDDILLRIKLIYFPDVEALFVCQWTMLLIWMILFCLFPYVSVQRLRRETLWLLKEFTHHFWESLSSMMCLISVFLGFF